MNHPDQEFLVQKIRTQYTEKEHTQLDSLKALDKKVKRPANTFAYLFGTISALVMGAGMSLTMNVIEPGTCMGLTISENMMLPGVIIGVIGMLLAIANYPIYKRILSSRKNKYAPEIIKLSDSIVKG